MTILHGGSQVTLISHPEAVTAVIRSAVNSISVLNLMRVACAGSPCRGTGESWSVALWVVRHRAECARKGGMDGGEQDTDGNGSVAEVTRSQPVLTPLTEAAIFLVLTVEPGGEDDGAGPAGRLSALAARRSGSAIAGRRAGAASSGSGRTRGTGCSPDPARPSCIRSGSSPAPSHTRRVHAGRPAVPHPGRAGWTSASSWPRSSWTGWPARSTVVDEVHGFKYFDERDLLGFVDGTENPTGRGRRARP